MQLELELENQLEDLLLLFRPVEAIACVVLVALLLSSVLEEAEPGQSSAEWQQSSEETSIAPESHSHDLHLQRKHPCSYSSLSPSYCLQIPSYVT